MRGWSIIGLGNLKDKGVLPELQAIVADATEPSSIKDAANDAIGCTSPASCSSHSQAEPQ